MPPVAVQGGVQVIHGDTSGNGNTMKVAVDDMPAKIVAAKPGTVFWQVPPMAAPGPHEVVFTPGPGKTRVALPLYVVNLKMSADNTKLLKGQSTRMHVTITGLEQLPASAWQSDLPPKELVDLRRWEERAGGARAPKASEPGMVVLVLENQSPQTIRMGSHGDRIVLQLHQRDFAKGPYTYEDKLQSLQGGGFGIRGTVTAFLKQATSSPRP